MAGFMMAPIMAAIMDPAVRFVVKTEIRIGRTHV